MKLMSIVNAEAIDSGEYWVGKRASHLTVHDQVGLL